ncbi:hypothetical protein DKX38_023809 [Salix brachista]|uniref:Uncharacterized protein n=1 Tax=Salix brachista TaxID=2182728 RepID=A0A5N5JPZ3_9ROSI|nr:hypothetical protein DKX38_023809 [Salix brachista]
MKIHKRHQKVILLGGGSPLSVIDLVFRLGVEEQELHLVIEKRCYVSDSSSYQGDPLVCDGTSRSNVALLYCPFGYGDDWDRDDRIHVKA